MIADPLLCQFSIFYHEWGISFRGFRKKREGLIKKVV
jgi:hypothetical protein